MNGANQPVVPEPATPAFIVPFVRIPDVSDEDVMEQLCKGHPDALPNVVHNVAAGTAAGTWILTGIRAHQSANDLSGDFFPVLAILTVIP